MVTITFTKAQLVMMFTLALPFFATLILMSITFPYASLTQKDFSPDIVNGVLALSGIIFAFQPIIFRSGQSWTNRYLFKVGFLLETTILGLVCFNVIGDIVNSIPFSGGTFWLVTYFLFTTLAYLVYFIFADLLIFVKPK